MKILRLQYRSLQLWRLVILTCLTHGFLLAGCGGGEGTKRAPSKQVLPPTFTSVAPISAVEGQTYAYTVAASDPSNGTVTYELVSAPQGATLTGTALTWTPTAAQARVANAFSLRATTSSGGTATQTWSVTPAGAIRGANVGRYHTASGETDVPGDLTKVTMAAYVPDGSGGFTKITGTGTAQGTFSIPAVPAGDYWLQIDEWNYLWGNSSNLDLGWDEWGRADAVRANLPTNIALTVTGLDPWQTSDSLRIYVANTYSELQPSQVPQAGNMSATGVTGWYGQLPDASKGDQAYVYQLVNSSNPASSKSSLQKAAGPLALTVVDGGTSPFAADLTDVSVTGTLSGVVKGTTFSQYDAAIHSGITRRTGSLQVRALPTLNMDALAATLAAVWNFPADQDFDLGTVTFGNPFPPAWPTLVSYQYVAVFPVTAPGAAQSTQLGGYISQESLQLPTPSAPLQPILTPVRSITINGASFQADISSVGTTPTIVWQPPAVGTVTYYTVAPGRVYNNAGATALEWRPELMTTNTSVQVPPGLLTAGNTYIFEVRAYYLPGVDARTTPSRWTHPNAWSSAFTALATP